jgi:hypothetical protein
MIRLNKILLIGKLSQKLHDMRNASKLLPIICLKNSDKNLIKSRNSIAIGSLANEKFYIEFLLGDIAFDIEYSL